MSMKKAETGRKEIKSCMGWSNSVRPTFPKQKERNP